MYKICQLIRIHEGMYFFQKEGCICNNITYINSIIQINE
jgi:hypothetical protein